VLVAGAHTSHFARALALIDDNTGHISLAIFGRSYTYNFTREDLGAKNPLNTSLYLRYLAVLRSTMRTEQLSKVITRVGFL
jgi:hypothetical protein